MTFSKTLNIIFASAAILGAVSCGGNQDMPVVPDEQLEERMVNLSLSVLTADDASSVASRADEVNDSTYFEPESSIFEKIHTLRVIIVRPNGNVEHNRLFTLSNQGVVQYDDMKFLVVGGEKKKIYIVANEAAVNYDFNEIAGGYENTIENIVLEANNNGVLFDNSGESKTWIPMCTMREEYVRIPESILDEEQSVGPFILARSAIKFSFTVAGTNGGIAEDKFLDYYVTDVVFNCVANQEYLLPRATYSGWQTNPGKDPYPGLSGQFISYINDYVMPEGSKHLPVHIPGNLTTPVSRNVDKPISWSVPIYYCECWYNPSNPDVPNPYTMSIVVQAKDSKGDFLPETRLEFPPVTLLNLTTIPRNTHVVVKMRIWRENIEATVKLVPYIGVHLDPEFGFDTLIPHPSQEDNPTPQE